MKNLINLRHIIRPKRVCYLIDIKKTERDNFLWIMKACQHEWGGRYRIFIPTDGSIIPDPWFEFIKAYDPDEVYIIPEASSDLKEALEQNLLYWKVEEVEDRQNASLYSNKTQFSHIIRNSPTKKMYNYYEQNILRIMEPSHSFCKVNFGEFEDDAYISDALQDKQCTTYDFNSQSLNALFEALLDKTTRHTTLNHLSKQFVSRNNFIHIEHLNPSGMELVIGDSLPNIIYFWNVMLTMPDHGTPYSRRHIWLPKTIISDDSIATNLFNWIKRSLNNYGGAPKGISLVSFDDKDNAIDEFSDKISQFFQYESCSSVKYCDWKSLPAEINYRQLDSFYEGQDLPLSIAGYEYDKPYYSIAPIWPGFIDRLSAHDNEISHVFEFKISQNETIWDLPVKRGVSDLFRTKRPMRITNNGNLAVEIDNLENIRLSLPDESVLFKSLLLRRFNAEHFSVGAKQNTLFRNSFCDISFSDKGRYAKAFIDMFGSLHGAVAIFNNPFWMSFLYNISGFNDEKTPKKSKPVEYSDILFFYLLYLDGIQATNNVSNTHINHNIMDFCLFFYEEFDEMCVQKFAKAANFDLRSKSMFSTSEFGALNKKNIREYAGKNPRLFEDLNSDLQSLVSGNILIMGYLPKCPHCGIKIFYSIDDIKSHIVCVGCRNSYILKKELPWQYKLNSLSENCIREQGTIPIILALDKIKWRWAFSKSFHYLTSIDLFFENTSENKREIDFACIAGGKFVIGEAKSSDRDIKDKEIIRCIEIAKEVRPDVFVYYLMSIKQEKRAKPLIQKLGSSLNDSGIDFLFLSK